MSDTSPNPRILSVPAPPDAEKPKARAEREGSNGFAMWVQKYLFAPIAILALAAVVLNSAYTAADRTRQWAVNFKLQGDSLFIDDLTRLERNGWGLVLAVKELRRIYAEEDPEGLTLAFTQADIAYYGGVPYISYFDKLALPFFLPQTKEELWSKLRDRNVTYLLVPGYPLSEVTNTAFNELLADPAFVEEIFNEFGHRVFQVRKTPKPIKTHLIAAASGEAMRPSDFYMSLYRASGPPASITYAEDGILINVPRRPLADRQRWDYLRPHDIAPDGPHVFVVPPGTSILSLELTGRGHFELSVVRRDRNKYYETQIWNGILLGERQTISGQFTVDTDEPAPMGFFLASHRVAPYVLHGWKVQSLAPPPKPVDDLDEMHLSDADAETEMLPAGPDITTAYIFRRAPTNTSAFDYLIRTGELNVRVEVAANAAPVAGIANCADGESTLSFTAARPPASRPEDASKGAPSPADASDARPRAAAPSRYQSDLACWPQSLSIVWPPSFETRRTDVSLLAATGQETRALPMVELGDMLDVSAR